MHGVLGLKKDIEEVMDKLYHGWGPKLRDEWESGLTLDEIAEKHSMRKEIVMKVISWDQTARDCREIGLL